MLRKCESERAFFGKYFLICGKVCCLFWLFPFSERACVGELSEVSKGLVLVSGKTGIFENISTEKLVNWEN